MWRMVMGMFNIKFNKKDRNINTFVCEVCKKELPKKYLHSHSVCADCANAKAKSTSLPKSTIKLDGPIRTNTEKETRINPIVSEKKEPLFEIIDIEYIELFDWNITLLDEPVTSKVAIDATNGDFYLLRGWNLGDPPLCKITDKRFVEITKEISDECYSQFAKLPEAKLQFVSTSTLPHKHIDYKNILHETIEIPHTSKILLKSTSLNGWILEIDNNKIILGFDYFRENTIHNLYETISKHTEAFSEDTLWNFTRIFTLFPLIGNCGYSEFFLMGSGYHKDTYRKISDNVQYRYENQILYISGTGATTERDEGGDNGRLCSDPEKSVFCDYILTHTKTVVFDEGITKIGKYFLSDFKVLEEIVLSSTITEFEKQSYGNWFVLPNVKHIKLYRGQHTPFDYSATIEYLGERSLNNPSEE